MLSSIWFQLPSGMGVMPEPALDCEFVVAGLGWSAAPSGEVSISVSSVKLKPLGGIAIPPGVYLLGSIDLSLEGSSICLPSCEGTKVGAACDSRFMGALET